MNVHFKKPTKKQDLVTAVRETILLAIGAANLNSPDGISRFLPRAYGHTDKIFKALDGKDEAEPENLAWKWLSLTLSTATSQFINIIQKRTELDENFQTHIKEFVESSLEIPHNTIFESSALTFASSHKVFEPARKSLPKLIHSVTRLSTYNKEKLISDFNRCLNAASAHVFTSNHDTLFPLMNLVSGIAAESVKRDLAWQRHNEWLQYRFQNEPVFSPDASVKTPLSSVYLRLRCYWHEKNYKYIDGEEEQNTWKVHIGDLHETLAQWLASPCAEYVRIVAGGPGSGKSSFAKAFSCETADDGVYRVVFLELQRLPFSGDLYSDIGKYLTQRHKPSGNFGSPGFNNNPIDWIKGNDQPTLFVFDGLDELTHDQTAAQEISRKFVLNVRQLMDRLNSDGTRVRAVVLGRSTACQEGLKDASLPNSAMLNVAPIRELKLEDFRPPVHDHLTAIDKYTDYPDLSSLPDYLISDQRPLYWERWSASQGNPFAPQPKAITHSDLSDLNVEPLLLHLLILSDFCGDRWSEAASNKNLVYEDILKKVHKRNVDKNLATANYNIDDFFLLMECLGLAAWKGNVRGGTEAAYEAVREVHAGHRKRHLENFQAADLRSVVLQTHARPLEGANPGFEFIHKSFGEYLAARGLLALAILSVSRMTRDYDPYSEDKVAEDWVKIIGEAEITSEVYVFLMGEVERRSSSIDFLPIKSGLELLYSWVFANGMPAHRVKADNFRKMETIQRCSELMVLIIGSIVTYNLQNEKYRQGLPAEDFFKIDWQDEGPRNLVNRMREHPLGFQVGFDCVDFNNEDLSLMNLTGISLSGANFEKANLTSVNMTHVSLWRTRLVKADLTQSRLRSSFLISCDASHANFYQADLRSSYLNDASFQGANFKGANLEHAHLDNSKFDEADFSDCNLKRCITRGTDFSKSLNLEPSQVQSFFGVRQGYGLTILPEGMKYPDFWHIADEAEEESSELHNAFRHAANSWMASFNSKDGINHSS